MLDPGFLKKVSRLTAMISEMSVTVILGVLAGSWLDSRLQTTPVLLLLLSVGALVLGMVRLTKALNRESNDDGLPPDDQP